MLEVGKKEISENQENIMEVNDYLDIKSEGHVTPQECISFWDSLFDSKTDIDELNIDLKEINTEVKFNNEKDYDFDTKNEIKNSEYYSTYYERIKQTPKDCSDRGKWDGERGESKFIPSDEKVKDILLQYGLDGIIYKDGIPDFYECSESSVEINDMTENRTKNFKQCDEKCAESWNKESRDGRIDWTPRDVAKWREENSYSWHERNDMKTCDLVPTKINDYFGHLGGVSECKKRDVNNSGGDFDE